LGSDLILKKPKYTTNKHHEATGNFRRLDPCDEGDSNVDSTSWAKRAQTMTANELEKREITGWHRATESIPLSKEFSEITRRWHQ